MINLKSFFNPKHDVPEEYYADWDRANHKLIRKRIYVMAGAMLVGMYIVNLFAYFLDPLFDLGDRIYRLAVLTVMMLVVVFMNNRAKTMKWARIIGHLSIVSVLFYFYWLSMSFIDNGRYFPFSVVMVISLFYVSLMIPWNIPEVLWIAFLHLIFNGIFQYSVPRMYLYIEDSQIHYFPFLNAFLSVIIASIFCLAIRRAEILKDVRGFVMMKQIEALNKQMKSDLQIAAKVHNTLIPKSIETKRASVYVSYLPMEAIGGDYARFHFISEDKLIFLMSDVTGHGVPAALIVNRMHAEFERLIQSSESPGEILHQLNHFIVQNFEGVGHYLTAFCGLMDFKSNNLRYSNYGHPIQYLIQGDKASIRPLSSQASFLGIYFDANEDKHEEEIDFNQGDRILLFTDGLLEARNNNGDEYGTYRLEEFVRMNADAKGSEWNQKLLNTIKDFSPNQQQDDVFLLHIKTHK